MTRLNGVHRVRRFALRMSRLSALVALGALASMFAAGCGSEDYYCDNSGCYYCDGLGCRPAQPPARPSCLGDYQCDLSVSCTTLGCTTVCVDGDDSTCPKGTVCRSNLCVGPSETPPSKVDAVCHVDSECNASGVICLEGVCVRDPRMCGTAACACDPAANPSTCASGYNCVNGSCRLDDATCRFGHECGDKHECVNGACTQTCNASAPSCPTGQECDFSKGICRNKPPAITPQCQKATECGAGAKVCLNGSCFDDCSKGQDCGTGRVCDGLVCRPDDRPVNTCASRTCENTCWRGLCRTPCGDGLPSCGKFDVQLKFCSAADDKQLCVTEEEKASNCALPKDCPSGQDCIGGRCR